MNPENTKLLDYLIERTKDAVLPLSQTRLAREFKEKSGALQTVDCIRLRINFLRLKIQIMEHLDMDTKVKLLFALSAPIDKGFSEKLKTQADVVFDNHQRIIKYRKNEGGLELEGIHFFFNEKSETIKRDEKMIAFLAEKSKTVNSPMTHKSFVREFKKATDLAGSFNNLAVRYKIIRQKIHEFTVFDENTKVRMLFVSGARVPNDFLVILRKNALVKVDKKSRIIEYRANDKSLQLQKTHIRWAITRMRIETSQGYCKQISNHFENRNENNEEMSNLIKFITEKCENVDSSLGTWKLAREFNNSCGTSKQIDASYYRMRVYCQAIQRLECLDTPTKVKQLFGMGASLNFEFLERLRNNALVEVDDKNRITKYEANDGSLILEGSHRGSSRPRSCSEKRNKKNVVATTDGFDEESDEEELDDDSDEYSSEEFDSDLDSDDEDLLNEAEDNVEPSADAEHIVKNDIKWAVSKKAKLRINEEALEKEIEQIAKKITPVKTRYGRLSKRSHLNSEFFYDLTDFNENPEHSKSAKKKKANSPVNMPPPVDPMILEESDDFQVKLEPFRGDLIENFTPLNPENGIQVIPKLREPKKEIEEEISIKTEDDLIIPKRESLEKEEEFKQAFNVPEDDIKVISTFELCEPKKEVEEEAPIEIEMMERPIKIEEDFIIPKLEEPEEEEKDSLPK